MDSSLTSEDKSHGKKCAVTYCFVPMCTTNSIKFPEKLFLTVPQEPKLREKWIKVARRQNLPSSKSVLRCCEDHFDMENDVENWIRYKLVGGNLILKKGVVPHLFDCQKRMQTSKPRSVVLKRKRQEIIKSIENEQAREPELPSFRGTTVRDLELPSCQDISTNVKKSNDKCVQVAICPYKRSKSVQVASRTCIKHVAVSPKKVVMKNQRTSPLKISAYHLIYSDSDDDSKKSNMETETSITMSGSVISDPSDREAELQELALQLTIKNITRNSKLYIGIPNDSIVILKLIQEAIQVPYHHICLVLKKLKLNESFKILGDDFGIHESTASRIFSLTCCKMANVLKAFIIKPSSQSVLNNLPIAFRNSFSKTYCIIDCLEIEIETPANALHQSLTYSSYKKCNTMKYLVSATPDGIINFISEGFGGRTSDIRICQESKFFECLPPGVSIMADRGFKHIEGELAKRNFTLIRPPSVSSSEKSSKKEVILTKKIASLRIHIERVIRRLREFALLKPHACVDHNLIQYLDSAIIICSALVNLQPSLIK